MTGQKTFIELHWYLHKRDFFLLLFEVIKYCSSANYSLLPMCDKSNLKRSLSVPILYCLITSSIMYLQPFSKRVQKVLLEIKRKITFTINVYYETMCNKTTYYWIIHILNINRILCILNVLKYNWLLWNGELYCWKLADLYYIIYWLVDSPKMNLLGEKNKICSKKLITDKMYKIINKHTKLFFLLIYIVLRNLFMFCNIN